MFPVFSQNREPRLTLKVRSRGRLGPYARQVRRTLASLVRVLQCIAFAGLCPIVISTAFSSDTGNGPRSARRGGPSSSKGAIPP
jgi:hypothetical protein